MADTTNNVNKYLDWVGLGVFWEKIKSFISNTTYSKSETYSSVEIDNTVEDIRNSISKHFVGTMAEYETAYANGEIAVGTIVIITNDSSATTAKLGTAILGTMILGQE